MVRSEPHSGREGFGSNVPAPGVFPGGWGVCVARWCGQVLGLLVPVSSHALRRFHFRPIDPLVWAGALPG